MITVEKATEISNKLEYLYKVINDQANDLVELLSQAMKLNDNYTAKYPSVEAEFAGYYMERKLRIFVSKAVYFEIEGYKFMVRDCQKVDDKLEVKDVKDITFPEKEAIDLGKWITALKEVDENGNVRVNSKGLLAHMKAVDLVLKHFKAVSFYLNQFINSYIDYEIKLKQKQEICDNELLSFMKGI